MNAFFTLRAPPRLTLAALLLLGGVLFPATAASECVDVAQESWALHLESVTHDGQAASDLGAYAGFRVSAEAWVHVSDRSDGVSLFMTAQDGSTLRETFDAPAR